MNNKRKYTDEHIAFVKANVLTMPFHDIAEHIGCKSGEALRQAIFHWRKQGHVIPFRRKQYQVGDIVVRKSKKRGEYKVQKTETGFKYVRTRVLRSDNVYVQPARKDRVKPPQQVYGKVRKSNTANWTGKADKTIQIKNSDLTGKVGHRLDSKTYVFAAPGKDINQFVAQLNKGRVG